MYLPSEVWDLTYDEDPNPPSQWDLSEEEMQDHLDELKTELFWNHSLLNMERRIWMIISR